MSKKIEGYEPLLLRGRTGSLWLGEDHLLVIENQVLALSYKEVYRRLDYSNIQAVLQGKSRRWAWQTSILILLLVFFGWLAVLSSSDGLGGFFISITGFFFGLFLILLLVHFARGPSASLVVQTAVKPWGLSMVTRRSHADKVMKALIPLCQQAQEQAQPSSGAAGGDGSKPTVQSPQPTPALASKVDNEDVPIHGLAIPAWICLLIFAALVGGELAWDAIAATVMMTLFGCAAFALLLICFGRGGGVRAVGGHGVFISAMVAMGINMVIGYIIGVAGAFMNPIAYQGAEFGDQTYIFGQIASFPTGYPEGLAVFVGVVALATGVTALFGALAASQQGKRIHQEEYTAEESEE